MHGPVEVHVHEALELVGLEAVSRVRPHDAGVRDEQIAISGSDRLGVFVFFDVSKQQRALL